MLAPSRVVARCTRAVGITNISHRALVRSVHQSKITSSLGRVTASQTTSASRYWPKYEIPQGAPQLIYHPKSSGSSPGDPLIVSWTSDHVFIQDSPENSFQRALKPATLRDSCTCAACKDPSSGQKSFASIEIPADIGIHHVRATEEGLSITFRNDIARFTSSNHKTTLPWKNIEIALKRRSADDLPPLPRKHSILRRTGVQYWDSKTLRKHVRKIDYAEFMKPDSESFWDVIIDMCRLGIVYLKNVPRDENSIVNITTRIANIRETFYGRTFDVRAKPNAENVAYTSGYLGLHQDLCYLSPPPMIQILHCMDNSCSGGESLFSDGERAGRLLWPFVSKSLKVAPLADHHVPYQYDKHGYFYHAKRSVIDHDENGFAGVYWSPPFQGRYENASVELKDWIEPARIFEGLINHDAAVHSYKMEEGECVLFDNLRTMHGRNAFDAAAGGSRWLRGAYIAAEDFLSRASYIPDGRAEMYRGTEEPWTPEAAHKELRDGEWYADVLDRVRRLDPSVEE
ncbi:hypothetical protein QQS21_007249 [Conoideocrella luteorostrata]|uniref:Gamma-butyrobetaine dioxygenase n=1 Tax=Conoideocrella luteorostrata TaxID=1105319 RepID=A0AAJ0CL89_9HYPO|nr:hypothetical protein QQS21_007249 [Conoideocrella luteorostrata]